LIVDNFLFLICSVLLTLNDLTADLGHDDDAMMTGPLIKQNAKIPETLPLSVFLFLHIIHSAKLKRKLSTIYLFFVTKFAIRTQNTTEVFQTKNEQETT
jgi:hypothetical protein